MTGFLLFLESGIWCFRRTVVTSSLNTCSRDAISSSVRGFLLSSSFMICNICSSMRALSHTIIRPMPMFIIIPSFHMIYHMAIQPVQQPYIPIRSCNTAPSTGSRLHSAGPDIPPKIPHSTAPDAPALPFLWENGRLPLTASYPYCNSAGQKQPAETGIRPSVIFRLTTVP